MGMLSKNQTILDDLTIVRNQDRIFCFGIDEAESHMGVYRDIGFGYANERVKADHISYYSKSTSVLSGPFQGGVLSNFRGRSGRKHRWVVNDLDKRLVVSDVMLNPGDVADVVAEWNKSAGAKYWRLHSGYDKNFFVCQYFGQEKDKLQCLFFYDRETMQCVGYSVISKVSTGDAGFPVFPFLLRKYVPNRYTDLCLYIDLKSIDWFGQHFDGGFLTHWGASSGGMLDYKMTKFPLFKSYPVWFGKIKQQLPEPASPLGLF